MDHVIKWNDSLKVGHEVIDAQHKILFDLANDLNLSVNTGADSKVIDTLFSVLTDYTYKHFATEENLLEGNEKQLHHCFEHYQLMKKLHDYVLDYHNGRTYEVDPGTFLEGWLNEHITNCDQPAFNLCELTDLCVEDGDIDQEDDFEVEDVEMRAHKRVRYDQVTDEKIVAHCYNASSIKNCSVSIIDISSGGMKIYSKTRHDVDDLLIISCNIGRTFKMKEKLRVINARDSLYGLEFVSPRQETVEFLTQLYGSVRQY